MLIATLLISTTPSSVPANVSPYSCLCGHSFDYSLFRTFGCAYIVLLPSHERDTLSFKTGKCIFLGYSSTHNGYQCYDPNTKRLRIARHVSFFENVPYYQSSHIPDLSFLDTTTTETSAHFVPTYTPSLLLPRHFFDSLSLLSRMWMFLLLILRCL